MCAFEESDQEFVLAVLPSKKIRHIFRMQDFSLGKCILCYALL